MKAANFMLDTDTFSYLVSGRHPSVRIAVTRNQNRVHLSSVTLAEALFGAKKKGSQKLLSLIALLREIFPVEGWDASAAEVYSDIRSRMERDGHPIGNMDLMIAASAISSGCSLVTNNERHFCAVPGLSVVNWTKADAEGA